MPRTNKTGRLRQTSQARRGVRHHNTGKRGNQKRRPFDFPENLAKKVKK